MNQYKVNEIFYSLQAEGTMTGKPAVFVRFAGCNLSCKFCDTNHAPYTTMTKAEIEATVNALDPTGEAIVVFTGGEPTLQLTGCEPICPDRFKTLETNGILTAPRWINWVTCSPKTPLSMERLYMGRIDEFKVLFGFFSEDTMRKVEEYADNHRIPLYLQPIASKDGKFEVAPVVEYIKTHPVWRLSLQWHKLFNIQ